MRLQVPVSALLLTIALTSTTLAAARADTLLAAGDVIDVQVYGEPTLTQEATIASDGSIGFPLLGRVVVAGASPTQAQTTIASGLKRYLRAPLVSVALHTQAPYNVLVLGNVKTPGRYPLPPGARVTDALAAAGGLNPITGPFPTARVTIGSDVTNVSLDDLLRQGNVGENLALPANAVVYVPGPLIFRVRVFGAVDHPGDIELNQGDRLAVAIAKAGNTPNTNADLNHIHITHTLPDGRISVQEVNLYKTLKEGDLASDVALTSDDIVYVPESAKKTDGAAGVLGLLRRVFIPF